MSGLFGGGQQSVTPSAPIIASLRVQTSVLGRAIPIVLGKTRVPANLLWYGDFTAVAHTETQSIGGKGGGGGSSSTTSYTYQAAVLMGLAWGEIAGIGRVWQDKDRTTLDDLGLSLYTGSAGQTAFPYLTANHSTEALSYRRLAYVAASAYSLGDAAQLGNHTFEVEGPSQRGSTGQSGHTFTADAGTDVLSVTGHGYAQNAIVRVSSSDTLPAPLAAGRDYYVMNPAADAMQLAEDPNGAAIDLADAGAGTHTVVRWIADADPAAVLTQILTHADFGIGYPSARIGDLTAWSNYCVAHGIFIAPGWTEQAAAADRVTTLAQIGNAELVFSEGKLEIIPWSDEPASGNGATYTPDADALFEFTDDDFIAAGGDDPISIERSEPADAFNKVTVTFFNRERDYDEDAADAKDDDSIALYGERPYDQTITLHEIVEPAVAQLVADTVLRHLLYFRNDYKFRLPPGKADLLEPMDVVALTDARFGLALQRVRIWEIAESDSDGEPGFDITAKEYPAGPAHGVLYATAGAGGYRVNFNALPGDVNTPVIFDAPAGATDSGFEIWLAVSGAGPNWGGCQVWVATDAGGPYQQIGVIHGAARHGVLSATFQDGGDPDTIHTCAVDLTVSRGVLTGGTQADADNLSTLAWIEGELIAFEVAQLTSQYHYDLKTYLRRGALNTPMVSHAAGQRFVRIDPGVFRYAYDPALRGKTLHIKLPSFNVFGAGLQNLADVNAYTHTPLGVLFDQLTRIGLPAPGSPLIYCSPDANGGIRRIQLRLSLGLGGDTRPDAVVLMLAIDANPRTFEIGVDEGTRLKISAGQVLASGADYFTIRAGSTVSRLIVTDAQHPLPTTGNLGGLWWVQFGSSEWRKVTGYDATGFDFRDPFDVAPAAGQTVNWVELAWADERPAAFRLGVIRSGNDIEVVRWVGIEQEGNDFYVGGLERALEGTTQLDAAGATFAYYPAPGEGTELTSVSLLSFADQGGGVYQGGVDVNISLPEHAWIAGTVATWRNDVNGIVRSPIVPVYYGGPL